MTYEERPPGRHLDQGLRFESQGTPGPLRLQATNQLHLVLNLVCLLVFAPAQLCDIFCSSKFLVVPSPSRSCPTRCRGRRLSHVRGSLSNSTSSAATTQHQRTHYNSWRNIHNQPSVSSYPLNTRDRAQASQRLSVSQTGCSGAVTNC